MRILFLGDVVGRTGREAVAARLPELRETLRIDLAIVNAENASHGFGLTPDMARTLFAAGADVITLGNHSWDRKEIIPFIAETPRLIRPLNYPPGTQAAARSWLRCRMGARRWCCRRWAGCSWTRSTVRFAARRMSWRDTVWAARFRLSSRTSTPRPAARRWPTGISFDGQISLVVGTHTHCPTADAQVLPGGTAFQSDAGMCGDYDSVIGMMKDGATLRFWRKMPGEKLGPAEGVSTVCGVFAETDDATGRAVRIEPVRIGGRLAQAVPTS